EGMWKILQHEKAEDFVLATGETHTIKEFAELAFKEIGVELEWTGKDEKEKGIVKSIDFEIAKKLINYDTSFGYRLNFSNELKTGHTVVVIDPNYYRPTEVDLLIGNPGKAEKLLNWKAKTKFNDLIKLMIKADLEKVLMRGY
ncbi:MAG: GDP-mannose 4,6-dehydratase, partial [Ignavibacteriaceae bacterium]